MQHLLTTIPASNTQKNAPTLRWSAHQASLEELSCDVLILLDCCTAGGASGVANKGLKEVIAACGFETWPPGVGEHSFPKSLTDELRQISQSSILGRKPSPSSSRTPEELESQI